MLDKTDDPVLIGVKRMIQGRFGIRPEHVKKDWFIRISRESLQVEGDIVPHVGGEDARRYIVHHPDIAVINDHGHVLAIVEIDGSIHRKTKAKTAKRNRHYEDAGIPYVAADVDDLKGYGMDLLTFVAEMLNKMRPDLFKYQN